MAVVPQLAVPAKLRNLRAAGLFVRGKHRREASHVR